MLTSLVRYLLFFSFLMLFSFGMLFNCLLFSTYQVVDAAAYSLRMIYQSMLAPKYDFFQEENMQFLLSLLKSENENLTGLGAGIVIHSCKTIGEQNILCHASILEKLTSLLDDKVCYILVREKTYTWCGP